MKNKISTLFVMLTIAFVAVAAGTSDFFFRIGPKGDTTSERKLILTDNNQIRIPPGGGDIEFTNDAGVSYKKIGSGSGGGSGINLLADSNADFESGNPPTQWTASGGTFAAETVNPLFGLQSASIDFDGVGQTLKSEKITIPSGFIGRTCQATFPYRWSTGVSGDILFKVIEDDGSETEIVSAPLDPTLASSSAQYVIAFDCPDTATDQLQFVLESAVADPDPFIFDDSFLGSGANITVASFKEQVSFVSTVSVPSNTNVEFNTITPIYDPFGNLTTNSYTFRNSGVFEIKGQAGYAVSSTAGRFIDYRINGGSIVRPLSISGTPSTATRVPLYDILTVNAGDVITFEARQSTGSTENSTLEATITQISESGLQEGLNLETSGFYISAIWENGANYALGTITQGDTSAGTSTGVLTSLQGLAQIPCDGSPSVGSTCPAVNERVGISWVADTAGLYETCMSYSIGQQVDSGGNVDVIVNLARVVDGTDTVLQYGEDRSTHQLVAAGGAAVFKSTHASLCEAQFLNAGRHTYHYRREQTATGTVLENRIEAGRVYFTVKKLNQTFPTPVFTDLQNSLTARLQTVDPLNNYVIGTARIVGSSCLISGTDQMGNDWLDACTRNAAGDYDLTVTPGTFSQIPACQVSTNGGTTVASLDSTPTVGNVGVLVRLNSTNAQTDTNWEIMCVGAK